MTDPRDDLPALDPSAAALLRAYRRDHAMPAAARARVADRLGRPAPVRAGAPDELPGTCSKVHVLSDRRSARGGPAWAVGLALAAAVLLWFTRPSADLAEQTGHAPTMSPAHGAADNAAAAVHARPGDGREPRQVTRAVTPEPRERTAVTSAASEPVHLAVPDSEPGRDDPPADPEPRRDSPHTKLSPPAPGSHSPRTRPSPDSGTSLHPKPDPSELSALESGSSLRDEQELLARGWRALAAGNSSQAARDAAEHARRFPGGVLTPERRALAAAAACRDTPAHGAELAHAFLADYPRSPLARRVREACERAP